MYILITLLTLVNLLIVLITLLGLPDDLKNANDTSAFRKNPTLRNLPFPAGLSNKLIVFQFTTSLGGILLLNFSFILYLLNIYLLSYSYFYNFTLNYFYFYFRLFTFYSLTFDLLCL